MKHPKSANKIEEMVVFALFSAMMFISAQIDIVPNVHPLALFIVVLTAVYRVKALIPIYLYVFLEGLMGGFGLWWIPYLYVWTVLWALIMLVPKRINEGLAGVLFVIVATLHGVFFGLLYMPYQCYTLLGGNWSLAWMWFVNGFPFDALHAVGNFTAVLFAIPVIRLLHKFSNTPYTYRKMSIKRN